MHLVKYVLILLVKWTQMANIQCILFVKNIEKKCAMINEFRSKKIWWVEPCSGLVFNTPFIFAGKCHSAKKI